MSEHELDPTQRTYKLKCRAEIRRIWVEDVNAGGGLEKFERKVVLLVPQEGSQRISFLNAWLPDVEKEYFEIGMFIAPPVDSSCRGAVMRANERYHDHHIYVMSKGIEEMIVSHDLQGRVFDVTVFPESGEDGADDAKDSDGSYDVI